MKLTAYEYLVLLHPTKKEERDGKRTALALGPTVVLAKDVEEVKLLAARSLRDDCHEYLDRLEVLVRPFCEAE